METIQGANVGLLIVDEAMPLILERSFFGLILEKMFASENNLKILTMKQRFVQNILPDIKVVLEDWSNNENLDLIFIFGTSIAFSFPENVKLTIQKEHPALTSLIFPELGKVFNNCFSFSCCILEKTLVLMLPRDLNDMFVPENWTSTIVSAIKEIKREITNLSASIDAKEVSFWTQNFKSEVKLSKIAERPRKSLYEMISVSEAVKKVLDESIPLPTIYQNVKDSYSFVLAEDVIAKEPYPPFPASIKDGYAVLASDDSKFRNVVTGITTGVEPESIVVPGCCIRVSTGSMVPYGADAVIQVEDTVVAERDEAGNELKIEILKLPSKNQDIRSIGSDIFTGEMLIASNTKISAAEIGILSVYGIETILTYQKPWISLLSTGDEILEPNMPLRPGCIRDSNKSSLTYALIDNRIPVIDVGIARDNGDDVKYHLMLAFESSDLIISTGGVSMGEKDLLKQVLEVDFNAKVHFGRVHMKPGKPTTFSTVNFNGKKKRVFSLPGNPVSAFVCFYLFVIPCIKKLMGFNNPEHSVIKVKLNHDHKLDERPEFCRATLNCGSDGVFVAEITGSQQSSRLSSMQNADVLLILPPRTSKQPILKAGLLVDAIPLKPL